MSYKGTKELIGTFLDSLQCLRKAIDGSSMWMDTVMLTPAYLTSCFEADSSSARRTIIYFVLGSSLGDILDKPNLPPVDFLRAIVLISQDIEMFAVKDQLPQAAVMATQRKEKAKRSLFARASGDFHLLHIPHFPFQPDYLQTLLSLLDILHDVYARLMSFYPSYIAATGDPGSSLSESFTKFHARTRKLLSAIHKDIDSIARTKINQELDGLLTGVLIS